MKLRINILGFDIATISLEFEDTVTVTPGYPPVVQTISPFRKFIRRGIKKVSTEWVAEGMT